MNSQKKEKLISLAFYSHAIDLGGVVPRKENLSGSGAA